jgi:uncharacterized protein YjbI with pentapeptide repeats
MANPYPFVAGAVLQAAELNGIGEKTSYTPTFTNLTLGNGTLTANYFRINKVVTVNVCVVFGTTTAITGDVAVVLPIPRAGLDGLELSTANLSDTGTSNLIGAVLFGGTLSSVSVRNSAVSGANVVMQNLSALIPFTWTSTDVLQFAAQYEVA